MVRVQYMKTETIGVYCTNIISEFENVLAPMCSYSTPKLIHMQRDRENIL